MSDLTRLPVLAQSPYDVVVGHHILDQVPRMLGETQRVAICHTSELVHVAEQIRDLLNDSEVTLIELPDGEAAKEASVAVRAWNTLGEAGFTRSDAVVTVGGGATTDMGGFIAATWLRGVRVVHVPTSLLAMVDAAVGGKTGMNTESGKNLVGAFHEPAGVVVDLDLLQTLPRLELVAGLGEVIKCGFIADPMILDLVANSPVESLDPRSSVLRELVERAIRVKIDVVVDDLKETGGKQGHPGREALNYGHTMAHAIETNTGYQVRHGEAVALGMIYVAELARLSGQLDDETAAMHRRLLGLVGLPTQFGQVPFEALLATMKVDKKARGRSVRFVILTELGRPVVLTDPEESTLRAAYEHLVGSA
ncbi:MAG TPA: 3-dehydroquinate synthase [Marmoricola sp.]|nr:3-dehydroquinate synthase [Marmoricola sp.]HNN48264.1 3-dehydroquinate synthase [Marmoricola sp.]